MPTSKRSRKTIGINNLIIVSDTHCGDKLGLCPKEGCSLDDGGTYLPSKLQIVVHNWWEEFWGEWVPKVTHSEPFAVVVNGDIIEGVHHRSTTPISHNLEDQCEIAYRIFKPIVDQCEGRFYIVRGTEAHVGISAVEEERLGKRLGSVPNEEGQYSRWRLRIRIGGALVDCLHHLGTTGSAAHETSAINAELASAFTDAARWGHEPPKFCARSHRHRCAEIRLPARNGYATSFVTAGWQLATPFAYKVAGSRVTTPQIGGSLIRKGDEEVHSRHQVWDIEPTPIEGEN